MAITNKQIIEDYKKMNGIPLDYPLYTYACWLKMGYRVKKGEASKHRVQMWKHKEKTIEKDGETITSGYCFGKTCYLFTLDQVEKIKEN